MWTRLVAKKREKKRFIAGLGRHFRGIIVTCCQAIRSEFYTCLDILGGAFSPLQTRKPLIFFWGDHVLVLCHIDPTHSFSFGRFFKKKNHLFTFFWLSVLFLSWINWWYNFSSLVHIFSSNRDVKIKSSLHIHAQQLLLCECKSTY